MIRRTAFLLLTLALLGTGVPAAAAAPLDHVAVVGDSYTTGTTEGGQGPNGWPTRVWQLLAAQGFAVAPAVAAEGGAGYVVRGNRGSIFGDLTPLAVLPEDKLVVFFGSRNDRGADLNMLAANARDAFAQAHRIAPNARLLVIGPAWTGAEVPPDVLQIRDVLRTQAVTSGAYFYDPLMAGWFVGAPQLIGGDGVHPTDAGHAYLADRIAPLLAAQLAQRT